MNDNTTHINTSPWGEDGQRPDEGSLEGATLATLTNYPKPDAYGALSMPVYHCCAFEFETAKDMTNAFTGRVLDPEYARVMNPTVTFFENRVKSLTGAANVFAFNSGMAAITNALFCFVKAGANIVTSNHLFGNTVGLMKNTLGRLGIEIREVNLLDLDAVRNAIDENTCCLFLEIITNPQMEVADVKALADICHAPLPSTGGAGGGSVPLIADTTLIPFTEFDGRALGIDAQVVSSTKYISAGATSLGGLLIDYGTFPVINSRTRFELLFNLGAIMTPHAAYMQTVGLESLQARYRMQSANALELAKRLQTIPEIKRVNYPGLPDNPFYDIAVKQYASTYYHSLPNEVKREGWGGSCMLTIDLEDKAHAISLLNNLKVIHRASNLFDNRSLALHPASTIYAGFSGSQRRAMDVYDTTIRLSVGLEDVNDLFNDIVQAIQSASSAAL